MSDQPRLVDLTTIANAMHIGPRRVQQLCKDGMPKALRGQYDYDACLTWYIRYLQKALESKSPRTNTGAKDVSFAEAKLRQAQADAALKELQLQRQQGEVIEIAAAGKMWADAVERMRSKMVASINASAVKCVGLENIAQSHAVLRSMVNAALTEVESIASYVEDSADQQPADE